MSPPLPVGLLRMASQDGSFHGKMLFLYVCKRAKCQKEVEVAYSIVRRT